MSDVRVKPLEWWEPAPIDFSHLEPRHIEELRVHAEKLRWQMLNDERPVPDHGWTCFHCAQTFTTWASASAHFGDNPLSGRPECVTAPTPTVVEAADIYSKFGELINYRCTHCRQFGRSCLCMIFPDLSRDKKD